MDLAKKKRIKKIISWVLLAALVLTLTLMPLMAKAEAEADGPVATIHSGTVETGAVSTALHGGGTLSTEDAEDVTIPSGVKITEFLVKNGDMVTEGTPLAAVDKVSVMTAITSVTETMEYLQDEMEDARDDKVSSTISATAGGRIKKVFAGEGDNVQDVMLRDGALALLSLDGLMAVKIEKKLDILTGETVTVKLSDETEISGRVESNLDGVIIITVEDEGYEIGETVTITTKNGESVGTGELYVHNAWTANAFSGIIKTVSAKEETKVGAGATLFTLSDTDFQGKLDYLSSLHREYEDLMKDLFQMYNTGTINAPCDGQVSGVDKDSAHLLSSEDGQWSITLLNQIYTPSQRFAAFAAQVASAGKEGLRIQIDPNLIWLDSLYNLRETAVDTAAMTQTRTYPAETRIYTQDASGALIPNGTAAPGDKLLFVGDESGVQWVVNLEQSVVGISHDHGGVQLSLLSSESDIFVAENPPVSKCNSGNEACLEESTDPAMHKQDCLWACIPSSNGCNATGKHHANCLDACTSGPFCSADPYHTSDCIESCSHASDPQKCSGTKHHYDDCIKRCENADVEGVCTTAKKHYSTCIQSCTSSNGTTDCPATRVHKRSCIEACVHAPTTGICPANTNHYIDCIESCKHSDSAAVECPATIHKDGCYFANMTYKARVAIVTGVGTSELVVRWDASGQEYDVVKTGSGWIFAANPDFNVDLLVASGPNVTVSNPKAYSKGDVIFVITGYKGSQAEWSGVSVFMKAPDINLDLDLDLEGLMGGLMDSLTGMLTSQLDLSALMGSFAGFGNFGFYATPPVEEDKLFDLEGSVLMTVSPETTVSLTITLDEQDIAKVSVGQKAAVKVEALPGEVFDAEVTEVSTRGSNSGGSSKFTVKLLMPKAKDMLDGMSASASLPMLNKENVPTIPVMALAEQGSQTVVYTALDEKTGEPANPVPVTIGLSDGITAEILSGLEAGDTYYYSYYDVLELDTGVEDRFTLG